MMPADETRLSQAVHQSGTFECFCLKCWAVAFPYLRWSWLALIKAAADSVNLPCYKKIVVLIGNAAFSSDY